MANSKNSTHACNHRIWKTEAGGSYVPGSLSYVVSSGLAWTTYIAQPCLKKPKPTQPKPSKQHLGKKVQKGYVTTQNPKKTMNSKHSEN